MKFAVYCILIVVASAVENCTFPDHTATQLYVADCLNSCESNPLLDLIDVWFAADPLKTTSGAAFTVGTFTNEYPIDAVGIVDIVTQGSIWRFYVSWLISILVKNNGPSLGQFYRDMTAFVWKQSLFDDTCKWRTFPTAGFLCVFQYLLSTIDNNRRKFFAAPTWTVVKMSVVHCWPVKILCDTRSTLLNFVNWVACCFIHRWAN